MLRGSPRDQGTQPGHAGHPAGGGRKGRTWFVTLIALGEG